MSDTNTETQKRIIRDDHFIAESYCGNCEDMTKHKYNRKITTETASLSKQCRECCEYVEIV